MFFFIRPRDLENLNIVIRELMLECNTTIGRLDNLLLKAGAGNRNSIDKVREVETLRVN